MVEIARRTDDAVTLYKESEAEIKAQHEDSNLDEIDRKLEQQNLNPVKLLTSGREKQSEDCRF